jgi:hypothetical protein
MGLALADAQRALGLAVVLASHFRDVNKCTMGWRAWVLCRSLPAARMGKTAGMVLGTTLRRLETKLEGGMSVTVWSRSRGHASMMPHSNDLGLSFKVYR